MQETQETWVWSWGQKDPLEEEMATHSSIFAWEIPWTEEPGRLQSMRSQRGRHDWGAEHTCKHRIKVVTIMTIANQLISSSLGYSLDPVLFPWADPQRFLYLPSHIPLQCNSLFTTLHLPPCAHINTSTSHKNSTFRLRSLWELSCHSPLRQCK